MVGPNGRAQERKERKKSAIARHTYFILIYLKINRNTKSKHILASKKRKMQQIKGNYKLPFSAARTYFAHVAV